jgi:hypothetical protein
LVGQSISKLPEHFGCYHCSIPKHEVSVELPSSRIASRSSSVQMIKYIIECRVNQEMGSVVPSSSNKTKSLSRIKAAVSVISSYGKYLKFPRSALSSKAIMH